MRLLDAKAVQINKTVRFKEFFDVDTPPYAILSHTWGQDEVTFHGLRSGLGEGTEGLKKIKECCAQAVVDGYAWVWIDTCCIDKSSSAELSEAINSMFKWYSNSAVCYAYLADVPSMRLESISAAPFLKTEPFGRSRWFSRAWTLQELIAPRKLEFYSRDWGLIGSKDRMLRELSEITTIHQDALMGDLRKFSVAQKLSWASKRQATRSEDTAYCLLGILGVNMPLLYGEGERAFIRLQEAFLSISDDQSLFAWQNLGPGILHNIGYTGWTTY
ncbi:HET-domain-containing protein [Tothia fuscella]|uniref:HET-domain-containing protein n=1 Tax=Tothia fuscella TaxID=1048955 RepID=A0A9P4NVR2_9PEZI|nr:HET-domain-containing protein [Tothia fuscella]